MSTQKESDPTYSATTSSDVETYLRDHPNFFIEHPAVLTELAIPHESGGVVSLVERQVSTLREQNQEVNRRMHELIEIARQNEELARRMHQLALTMMDSADPRDIFSTLYDNLAKNFKADKVAVRLFADPGFVDIEAGPEFAGHGVTEESLFKTIIAKRQPLCGRMKHQQRVFLFGDDGDEITSAVMLPLKGFDWCGILAIGSFDAERFQPGMGVELLANLGEILSLILKPWIADR